MLSVLAPTVAAVVAVRTGQQVDGLHCLTSLASLSHDVPALLCVQV
jgi:hypothetical protein